MGKFDFKNLKISNSKPKKKKNTPCKEKRFHDIREMLDCVCRENSTKPAFYTKINGKFRPITFSRLRSDIRSLGAALMHRGLAGKKILLLGDNCYHWALSYLTALCGLGVIIPVSKEAPTDDLCNIAKVSGAAAIIYSPKCEEKINSLPKKLQKISFDELSMLCEHGMSYSDRELHEFDSISIDADALATILFTKGTTGNAKGVMLSQRNLCFSLRGLSASLPEETGGVTLALLPLHYAYESVAGLLLPLSRARAIAFAEGVKLTMLNAREISPSSIVCTPSIIERLYKKIWTNIRRRGIEEKVENLIRTTDSIKIPSLKQKAKRKVFSDIHESFGGKFEFFLVGGSVADPEAISGMRAFGFTVIQTYGLTETASIAALTPYNAQNNDSIGTVLPMGELKISDPSISGIGEICYRGDNVMLGYYKQDELNLEVKQNGWIRTGDIGSISSDGYLTVLGRKKNVICVSQGKAVFPEELEILVSRSPYVKECAVIGIKNSETRTNDLVAVIFPDYSYSKDALGVYSSRPMVREKLTSVIAEVNAHLPQHKRISYFIQLDEEIPKNAYKKIERHSLPDYIQREYLAFDE